MSKVAILSEIRSAGLVAVPDDLLLVPNQYASNGNIRHSIYVERNSKERLPRTSNQLIQGSIQPQAKINEGHNVGNYENSSKPCNETLIDELEHQTQSILSTPEDENLEVEMDRSDSIHESDHDEDMLSKLARGDKITILMKELSKDHLSWRTKSLEDGKKVLGSCDELSKLKISELKIIIQFVRNQLGATLSVSGSKASLIMRIKTFFKLDGDINLPSRKKKVTSLKVLTSRILQGQKYPKAALNISYAEWKFPDVVQKWRENTKIKHAMCIPDVDSKPIDWFYVPEFWESRTQLEVKRIDSHHLLTRHRSAICKGNIGHAKKQHFIEVASENSTPLKLGMMEEQLNMQSTDFALITFSRKVAESMRKAGHSDSAELCSLVHDWFAANDEPGIPASERCQMKLRYRDYLLSLHDLSFPPPGSHIRGYSVALWEATLSSIDADLQMYAITRRRTYNNRALSSQPCESLYSCLATMPGAKNGVPSAVDLEVNMAKICGECVVRQDPTRGFSTRLSSAPVYPQILLEKGVGPLQEASAVPTYINEISVVDHLFDSVERRRLARREPKGISSLHMPGRGGQGVRQYHKINESKINPLIRVGVSCK